MNKFNLLRKHYSLIRKENQLFARWCKKFNMNYVDINILSSIYDNNGVSEPTILAEELLTPKQTMTGILDKLEKAEYIKRCHSKTDRRRIEISITQKGIELISTTRKLIDKADKKIQNSLSSKEIEIFFKVYNQIIGISEEVLIGADINADDRQ